MVCFALDKRNGLGKVYIVPKRFKCSFALVTGIIEIVEYVNLKNNIEVFQRNEVPFPVEILVYLNELQKGHGIIQNLKKGKAKWHKNCALELSASKYVK